MINTVFFARQLLREEASSRIGEKGWYESEFFFLAIFIFIVVSGVLLILYTTNRVLGENITDSLKDKDFILVFILTFAFSTLPLFDSLAVLLPLLIIWKLLKRTSHLEQCLRKNGLYE